uniref:Uncharacterized protein n=1 Tax=Vespula pensylvanica TaxID=30213 RepID=A0A834PEW3_VESPE|nr:hypothetical protein H0235_000252 [Vespula pensylvanica]
MAMVCGDGMDGDGSDGTSSKRYFKEENTISLTLIRIAANCCELAKVANERGSSGNRCPLIDRRYSHPHDYLAHKHIHDRNEGLNVDPLRTGPSRCGFVDPPPLTKPVAK